ncbi:galactose mutarotase [Mucilaginibacter limnophilus]|uniref:Aldose 1-epimerase n=1 Tax=Mucilaginibacter limnophilus TaxID=1932778 RepID=A0A3S2WXX0_9SPHI|nr:aldose epimerase family protein [Mucilaginibacter limnophilus]RVU00653.1 galactose mutarotase [Mucilaginibacter limnophilus]
MIREFVKPALAILPACALYLAACNQPASKSTETMSTDTTHTAALAPASAFDTTIDGKAVHLFTLKNKNGVEASITNYGGRIVNLLLPDKDGKMVDVIVGPESAEGYLKSTEVYYGATIGRYGNRIAKGKFKIDGKEYSSSLNNGANMLHGGKKGFQSVIWDGKQVDSNTVELTYLSKDGEEGFPGNLNVKVTFHLTDDNALDISYEAKTDKKTVVNLTNHAFYNLNGSGSGDILKHTLWINADNYLPVDSGLIPLGPLEKVAGTPFDFTKPTEIGARIETDNQQLKNGKGYDHNFVLNKTDISKPVATITGDKTGITLDIYTPEPGLQFYSGNFMQAKNVLKYGIKDEFRTSFALETQHFPDSPNRPEYPSTELNPGQTYKTHSIYKFSVKK